MDPLNASWDILHDDVIEKKKKLMRCAQCKGNGFIAVGFEKKWERTRTKPQGEMVPYAVTDTCPRCKGEGRVMMGWLGRYRAKREQLREQLEEARQVPDPRPPGLDPKLCWDCQGTGLIVDSEGNRIACPHCQPSQDE